MAKKYYVVWEGLAPGIYDSWEECQLQVTNYPGAKYKSYATLEAATEAFRGTPEEQRALFVSIASHKPMVINWDAFPEIITDAVAVDGACSKNPGPMEYRGVHVGTGKTLFQVGPIAGGTNNIGEYLALVHALALFAQKGDTTTPIYSDSRTALAWLRNKHSKSTLMRTDANAKVFDLLERADRWVATHTWKNKIIKWNTEEWGEIPADFGRK
jgi:ribonuclease HI